MLLLTVGTVLKDLRVLSQPMYNSLIVALDKLLEFYVGRESTERNSAFLLDILKSLKKEENDCKVKI